METKDLNLLVVFDTIMTEVSISKAALRLNITQPAVSNAVARMRHIWRDDLFVKNGRNIKPTVFAKNLWSNIKEPLNQIREAVLDDNFSPLSSNRTFKIAAVDAAVSLVWPKLRALFEENAPNISLLAAPFSMNNAEAQLNQADVDFLIGPASIQTPHLKSKPLYELNYVCVMRPDHPLAKKNLTLQNFIKADHLLVSVSGDAHGYTDTVLSNKGLTRNVAMTVNSFSSISRVILETNLISIVPSLYVKNEIDNGSILEKKSPIKIPKNQINLFWHQRAENDSGSIWLREIIEETLKRH